MSNKERIISTFLKTKEVSPLVAAFAAGLYPLFFYYSNNYTLIGAWEHMTVFFTLFIVTPVIAFIIASRVIKMQVFKKIAHFVLPFLNLFFFFNFVKLAVYPGTQWLIIIGIFTVSAVISFFFSEYFKKWVVIQLVLAIIGFITLVPKIITQLNYSTEWQKQPDDITEAIFKSTPNIYLIQPDGYVNFSELKKGEYGFDNSAFEGFLKQQHFKSYANFRSNYAATLATNSSLFAMKHHYYNEGASFSETLGAREVIMTDNALLTILKNNGYKTSFFSEHPYFLLSRPTLGYDKSNFTAKDVSSITTGMTVKRDVLADFENNFAIEDSPVFTFIQVFNPKHITRTNADTKGVAGEKAIYLDGIKTANDKLARLITLITKKDPNALIVIMADHGGFVGFEHTGQAYKKTEHIDLKRSIFSAILTVKWPNDKEELYSKHLKSPVNLFRILTAYLSEEPRFLENLQDDGSYLILNDNEFKGVYKYFDDDGESTFKKQ